MVLRTSILFAAGLSLMPLSAANACQMDFKEQTVMRAGFCGMENSAAGCTSVVMTLQVADQFKEIALARRCGFNAEADQLDKYYKLTTPLVVKLYECVDKPIDRAGIEQKVQADVDKHVKTLPEGCADDVKKKMSTRLPKLIEADKKSLEEIQQISVKLGLDK